jgi:hypothetical protein
MGREPREFLFGEALQGLDGAQGCNDIRDGIGVVRAFGRHHLGGKVHNHRPSRFMKSTPGLNELRLLQYFMIASSLLRRRQGRGLQNGLS